MLYDLPMNKTSSQRTFAFIGLGSQTQAWALYINEATFYVRSSSSLSHLIDPKRRKTINPNEYFEVDEDIIFILIPDSQHASLLRQIKLKNPQNHCFVYAHGKSLAHDHVYNIHPDSSHLLLAPKAIAQGIRENFQNKTSTLSVYSTKHLRAEHDFLVHELANILNFTLMDKIDPEDEMRADLFSEQTLLCGLIPFAALESFKFLLQKNIPKHLAYLECWHEVKLIVDTIDNIGFEKFFEMISPDALMGTYHAHKLLLDSEYKQKLETIWQSSVTFTQSHQDISQMREDLIKKFDESGILEIDKKVRMQRQTSQK